MILDEILAHKRSEVEARRALRPLSAVEDAIAARTSSPLQETRVILSEAKDPRPVDGRAASPFQKALRQPGVGVIAEIKRKSPSGGELRPGVAAASLARAYAAAGAVALSVLTDARYFGGSDADLQEARKASRLPVLRKDFVVDSYQIYESAAIGANAILLIVRALSDRELSDMLALTRRLGMDALVETHSADELQRALAAGARIVGVNNRDLDTLVTDVSLALRLRPLVPSDKVFVAESGISEPEQITQLAQAGVDAVLIGESLLRAANPEQKLRGLVAAGAPLALRGSKR